MKHKFLKVLGLSLLGGLLGIPVVAGVKEVSEVKADGSVTFNLSSNGNVSKDSINVSFDKGEGTSAPTWYSAGLRLYTNNTVTISSENTISGVSFNWEKQGSKTFATIVANCGTYAHPSAAGVGTWTGSSKEVVFTVSTSGQLQLNTFTVDYVGGTTPTTTYTVAYNANGGSGEMVDANSPYTSGSTVTVLDNAFTAPSGKEFNTWNTKADGSGTSYKPGDTFKITGNTELFAKWNLKPVAEGEYFQLVTSLSDISSGDEILFARSESDSIRVNGGFKCNSSKTSYWLETTTLPISDNIFYLGSNTVAQPIKLGANNGSWTFQIGSDAIGIKKSTTSNKDLIKTTTSDAQALFNISIDQDNVASVIHKTETSKPVLGFNSSTGEFANYGSTSGTLVKPYIFKKVGTVAKVTLEKDSLDIFEGGSTTLSVSKCEGLTPNSYAWSVTEGSDKVQLTAGTTTSTVTVKCLAVGEAKVQVTVNGTVSAVCNVTVKSIAEAIIQPGNYFVVSGDNKHQMTSSMLDTTEINLTNMDNAWTFEFAYEGDNTYYIKSSGGYLTRKQSIDGSGSNTELALSAVKYDYFTATKNSDNSFSLVPSSKLDSSLGIGTDNKWRACNGTNNKVFLESQAEFDSIGYKGTLAKDTYNAGDQFDPTGLTFFVKYVGSNTEYPLDSKDISWNLIEAGKNFATGSVIVAGQTRTVTVTGLTVTNFQPESIALSGNYQVEYRVGEKVNLENLVVTLTSRDGGVTKEDVLTNKEYDYSPKTISADTTKVTITYKEDTTITASFNVSVLQNSYVVANYIHEGDRIVIASMDYDSYGINGGEELAFNGTTPTHEHYTYSPVGAQEFVVESTTFGDAVALKSVSNGQYLVYNGKKFGYPERDSITVNGSSDAYDFNYYVVINGKELNVDMQGGALEEDGSISGFYGFEYINGYVDYVTFECLLDNSGAAIISYDIYTSAAGYEPEHHDIEYTWEMNGSTPIIYKDDPTPVITDKAAWNISYDKNNETWDIQPYTDSEKYCSYNTDGDGNFAFYKTKYDPIQVYRNNTYALASVVNSISVNKETIKTEYELNEKFAWTGLEVTAHYAGGISSTVPVGGYDISMPDMTTAGVKTITVTYGPTGNVVTTSFTIEVKDPEPVIPTIVSVEVTTKPTKLTYYVGETLDLTGMVVTAHMSDGSDQVLTEDDYTVNFSGTSTTGIKTVTINVKNSGGKYAQFQVSVVAVPVTLESLTLSGQKTEYKLGETFEFTGTATAHYSNGTSKSVTPTQFSPVDMSTVGTKTVTVYYTEDTITVNAEYTITVTKDPEIVSIAVTGQKTSFTVGESFSKGNMVVTATYDNGETSTTLPYDVDSSKFNGNAVGTYEITVTVSGFATPFTYNVTVSAAPINEIELKYTSSKEDAKPGDTQELFIKKPADADVNDFNFVSSDESVATVAIVDGHAIVTYVNYGSCTITVTPKESIGGSGSAVYTVNILKHVESVSLNKESDVITIGSTSQLEAILTPSDSINKNVTWSSSDKSVATVDQNGLVTGVGVGSATITVTTADGGLTATCEIYVIPVAAESVSLNVTSHEMKAGDNFQLVATVLPENATNKGVTWSSSNESVAKVDANGKVTAIAEGNAIITVKTLDGEYVATCAIKVTVPHAQSVSLNKTDVSLKEGETYTLVATVTPSDAINKNLVWSSSNTSVASVDQNGKVTAISEGNATITVKTVDGNHVATCTVSVSAIHAESVSLNMSEATIKYNETTQLVATVNPTNAKNKDVTWSSSDTSIATVDQNGKVTAVKGGTVTITVTTKDGNLTASCVITVKGIETDVDMLPTIDKIKKFFGCSGSIVGASVLTSIAALTAAGLVVLKKRKEDK